MAQMMLPDSLESQLRSACQEAVEGTNHRVSGDNMASKKGLCSCFSSCSCCEKGVTANQTSGRAVSHSFAGRKLREPCQVLKAAMLEQKMYQVTQPKSKAAPAASHPRTRSLPQRNVQAPKATPDTLDAMKQFALANFGVKEKGSEDDSLTKLLKTPSLPLFPPTWLTGSYAPDVKRAQPGGYGGAKPQTNYDEEARKLWQRLNIDPSEKTGRHIPLDVIWCHPETNAKIYIGNESAAKNMELLEKHSITNVVNCTDSISNFHERKPGSAIKYFRFDICRCYELKSEAEAICFTEPVLNFISEALGRGENVMAHCLAGAHRAGTTGIICLMFFAKLNAKDAKYMAKQCRPIIDPIANFPALLAKLERAWGCQAS